MKTYKNILFELGRNNIYRKKRKVPFATVLKFWIKKPLTYIGIIILLLGLPFVFGIVSFTNLFSPSFSDEDPVAIGVIVESTPTNSYVNTIMVFEYKYQYKLSDGNIYSGVGYSTGDIKKTGEEIRVRYKQNYPEKSKAIDLRNIEYRWIESFTLISPLLGMIMLFFSTRITRRQILILKVGNIADGKLLFKEPASAETNNQTLYKLVFEYTASDNKVYQGIAKTYLHEQSENRTIEKLVYDPENQDNVVLLDDLPEEFKDFFLKLK